MTGEEQQIKRALLKSIARIACENMGEITKGDLDAFGNAKAFGLEKQIKTAVMQRLHAAAKSKKKV